MNILHKRKPGRTGYKYWGCRCPECRQWNTNDSRRYRALHGTRSGWPSYNARTGGAYSAY